MGDGKIPIPHQGALLVEIIIIIIINRFV